MKAKTTISVLLLAGLFVGCTAIYEDANELHSFQVSFSAGTTEATTGTDENRLPYVSGASCAVYPCPAGETCIGYCGLSGNECGLDDDCSTGEICVKVCAKPIKVDIQAIGRNGKPYMPQTDELWVNFAIHPGFVPPPFRRIRLVDGKADNVLTYIARAVGESYLWAEDLGEAPKDELYGQCNDGLDNDGDGWIDLADPDCLDADDGLEQPASYATGLSPAFYFENPRIRHLQYTDQVATSPLVGESVYVNSGRMVVTNITASGFFVTDLTDHKAEMDDGTPGYFNSLFMYTFNKPEGVRYGDTLCSLSGGIVEYQGNTQIKFPSFEILWEIEEHDGVPVGICADHEIPAEDINLKVPDPVDVSELLVPENPASGYYKDDLMANSLALEPFESSLIMVKDAAMSTRFLACDANENGYIDGPDEDLCRDECQNDPLCTQLESYFKYQQATIYVEPGKKFYVGLDMIKELVPLDIAFIGQQDQSERCLTGIDPATGQEVQNPHTILLGETRFIQYHCPSMLFSSVTGNYRQIYLCPVTPGKQESCSLQLSMLIPRFDEDVVLTGEEEGE